MIEPTPRQKHFLRGMGQTIECSAAIGKGGLTAAVARMIDQALSRRELVKVKIPPGGGEERGRLGQELAEATKSCCLGVVGRTVLLYRPNLDLPPDKRVALE